MEAFHLFIERYPQAGGLTTGIIVGEDSNGTTSEYLTNRFNGTGAPGKRASIGRSTIRGVSKVITPEGNHNNLVTTTVTAKIRTAKIRTAKIRTAKIRTAKIRTVVTMTAETVDREGRQTNPQQGKPERGGEEKRDRRRLQNEKVTFWNNTFGFGNCISYSNDGGSRCRH